MNSVTSEALEVRLVRLERSLRRARWGLFGLLLLVVAMFLAWYGVGGIVQREIRVHRIYAVDDSGTVRVRIGQDPAGADHRMSPVSGVVLYDGTGLERGGMATMANGRVALGLDAPTTPKGTARDRVGLMVDGKGNTMFMLLDARAMPVVMAQGGDKGGNLQVSELSPDGKQLQVRTLAVGGDKQSTEDTGN
ncbi:hypothetical protein [Rhodanobacter sp. PCA2]|uniref:hypothetical protein n=1 Tax=Rhodanobacter sp. PCA2 TaxID=2006117 RepID=UPI0015E65A09|nr:hypothetical protein [Rhodanobacter sp. PCA2]MBA2077490.1 hypothetical protein [Rhodanobacter sp. PCA2]